MLAGKGAGKRHEFIYVLDSGDLAAVRYDDWKLIFSYQDGEGPDMWFSGKRFNPAWPYIINVRSDPFEYATNSGLYTRWYGERIFLFVPGQMVVRQFAESLIEYPPSQAPGSLGIGPLKEEVKQKVKEMMAQREGARKAGATTNVGEAIHHFADEVEHAIARFQQAHP